MAAKKAKADPNSICLNRKARFDYALEDFYKAGMVLSGWELKSIRAGKAQIAEGYVVIKNGEAWLLGSNIMPLVSASTHVVADPNRTRKLLLTKKELHKLTGVAEQKGYTLIPTKMFWSNNRVKLEFAVGKGKKLYDKREAIKKRDCAKENERVTKLTR